MVCYQNRNSGCQIIFLIACAHSVWGGLRFWWVLREWGSFTWTSAAIANIAQEKQQPREIKLSSCHGCRNVITSSWPQYRPTLFTASLHSNNTGPCVVLSTSESPLTPALQPSACFRAPVNSSSSAKRCLRSRQSALVTSS